MAGSVESERPPSGAVAYARLMSILLIGIGVLVILGIIVGIVIAFSGTQD